MPQQRMRETKRSAAFQKVLPSSEDMHVVKIMLLQHDLLELNLSVPQEKSAPLHRNYNGAQQLPSIKAVELRMEQLQRSCPLRSYTACLHSHAIADVVHQAPDF